MQACISARTLDRETTKLTPTCKAALLYCIPVAGTERPDFCKVPKIPHYPIVTRTVWQPQEGLRLPSHIWEPSLRVGAHVHGSKHPIPWPPAKKGDRIHITHSKNFADKVTAWAPSTRSPPGMATSHWALQDGSPKSWIVEMKCQPGHHHKCSRWITKPQWITMPCCSSELEQFGDFQFRRNPCSHGTAQGHRRARVSGPRTLLGAVFYASIFWCYFYKMCLAKDTSPVKWLLVHVFLSSWSWWLLFYAHRTSWTPESLPAFPHPIPQALKDTEKHRDTTTAAVSYILVSNAEGSHMLVFIHPIIQGRYLSINALRCRAKPKQTKSARKNSNSSGLGKEKWGCCRDGPKSKRRDCYRYSKSWVMKKEEKATKVEAQLI